MADKRFYIMEAQKQQSPRKNAGETVMALLSYFSILLFIPLFQKKKSEFVAYHVNQGLVLFVLEFCFGILLSLVAMIFKFVLPAVYFAIMVVFLIISAFFLSCHIVGIVHVCCQEKKKIPIFGEIHLYKPEQEEENVDAEAEDEMQSENGESQQNP